MPIEHADLVHQGLKRPFKLPLMIMRIIVVRRDEYRHVRGLGRCEQHINMLNGPVSLDIFANNTPGYPIGAQKIILWIGNQKGGPALDNFKAGVR